MSSSPLRIAIVSTPRSGNTWVRHLLADAYCIPHLAVHSLHDQEWDSLPGECVLQLHARRTPEFEGRLHAHGFRVLTLARHPFDVLVSILQFTLTAKNTADWLHGAGGDETSLYGAMPRSRSFTAYATSPRAAELLAVTTDWWRHEDAISVRYEEFVADALGELSRLQETFGPLRTMKLQDVVKSYTLDRFQAENSNNHFWQGTPGLWRSLLPRVEAEEIASVLASLLDRLGYRCESDATLTADEADRNWVQLAGPGIRRAIARANEAQRSEVQAAHDRAASAEAEVARLQTRLASLDAHFRLSLEPFRGLDHSSVRIAKRIQGLRDRLPRIVQFLKRWGRTLRPVNASN
jgi:hypothetical protein